MLQNLPFFFFDIWKPHKVFLMCLASRPFHLAKTYNFWRVLCCSSSVQAYKQIYLPWSFWRSFVKIKLQSWCSGPKLSHGSNRTTRKSWWKSTLPSEAAAVAWWAKKKNIVYSLMYVVYLGLNWLRKILKELKSTWTHILFLDYIQCVDYPPIIALFLAHCGLQKCSQRMGCKSYTVVVEVDVIH